MKTVGSIDTGIAGERARDDVHDFGLILVSGRQCYREERHVGGCGEERGAWVGEEEKDVCNDGGRVVRRKAEEKSIG